MPQPWQEAALFNTVMVTAMIGEEARWTGTAFFVLWISPGGGKSLYLVSNRHVLADAPDFEYVISLHRRGVNHESFRLGVGSNEVWIDTNNPVNERFSLNGLYYCPDDEHIDLACVNCTHLLAREDIVIVPFSQTRILDWVESSLYPAQPVLFVGYPDGIRDMMHNLPVVRTGTIASHPHLPFDNQPDFLIDAEVWDGSSGSPVFVQGTEEGVSFSLIGIVHSTTEVRNNPDANLGLGYAVRSSELVKLLADAG